MTMSITFPDLLRLSMRHCAAGLVIAVAGCSGAPEDLERRAMEYLAKGDRNSASVQFKDLIARNPKHAEAYFQLGRINAEIGALLEAQETLGRALELGKPAGEVMPILGRVLLDLEKYKELQAFLEPDPKRTQPTDPGTLAEYALLRGQAALSQGDTAAANTQFQLAAAARPAKAKLALAHLAVVRNERERAEQLIEEVIASSPANAEAHLALAELRRTSGALDKALPHYAEAARLEPDNVNTMLVRGIALINANRLAEAQPLLDKARKSAPAGPLLHFSEALIECKERRYQKCGELLEKVFAVLPRYLPALLLTGQLNYALGNYEQAQNAFVRYLERAPVDIHARKLLAATLIAKKQPQIALRVLRPLLGTRSEDPQLIGLSGEALLQLGHIRQARDALVRAVQLAPENPEFRTALALTHLAGGLRRRAEADFRAAIALKPAHSKADYGLIMMLLGENRLSQAQEAVAAVEQRVPNSPETYMLKGIVLRATKDQRGARGAFLSAIKLAPNFFPAIQELADMDLEDGKEDAARARIGEVLRRNPNHMDALLTMADMEFRAGRRAEGLSFTRQAADANPESTKALLAVSEAQADAGDLNEAIRAARQALLLRPRDPQALRALGEVQMAAKDYAGAANTFTTLVDVQPGSADAYVKLASAHVASGDSRTAIFVARNALKRNPGSAQARMLVGNILLNSKKYSEALDFSRQIQKESPKSSYGFRLEGEAFLAQGDARRAVKAFELAGKLAPDGQILTRIHRAQSVAAPGSEKETTLEAWIVKNPEDNQTRVYLAETLNTKRRYPEAATHYRELARRFPKDARTLNNLAWALHASGNPEAVQYAEQAYRLVPSQPAVLDTYGWILVNQGKLHEGIQILLQAVALDGKNPEIRYHLAKGLAQAGDKARARTELKSILSSSTPFPQADDARALLASLGS